MLTEHPLEQAEPFERSLKMCICSLEQSKSYTLFGPFRTVKSIYLEIRAITRIVWDTFVINSFFFIRMQYLWEHLGSESFISLACIMFPHSHFQRHLPLLDLINKWGEFCSSVAVHEMIARSSSNRNDTIRAFVVISQAAIKASELSFTTRLWCNPSVSQATSLSHLKQKL